jgi:NitT/TauT family transport system permease protein
VSKSNTARWLRGAIVPVALLLLWQVLSIYGVIKPGILPAPTTVALRWWQYLAPNQPFDAQQASWLSWIFSGELPRDALGSMYRVSLGFFAGVLPALPLGLLMGVYPRVYELFNPLVQIIRPIPPIAFIPLAILWFGLGNPPSVFLIGLGAFFPVLMNTIAGVRSVDSIYVRAALNLGARPGTLFWRVILPAAMPYILAGMRIGIGTAFIVVIVSEMIAVNNGLGYRILEAREFMWSDKIIAGMITIGMLGLAIDSGMSRLNSYLLRWQRGLGD